MTRVIYWLGLSLACMASSLFTQNLFAQALSGPQNAVEYPFDSFTEFSAVMTGSAAGPSGKGHIYRSGKLMRMEDPGNVGYFITDLDTGETFGMSEMNCIQDSHPFIRAIPFRLAAKSDAKITRAPAGKETIDGHSCQIEDVTVSSAMLPEPLRMRLWEADDLHGFPIKIEFLRPGGRDQIIRYENVILGPQDPTLFLHPKSCPQLQQ